MGLMVIIGPIMFAPIGLIIGMIIGGSWYQALLIKFNQNLDQGIKKINFKGSFKYIFGLLIFQIIFAILASIGYIIFIVPGIIVTLMFFFFPFVYCLRDAGFKNSFKLAPKYSKGYRFAIWARMLYLMVLNFIVSIILFVLGDIIFTTSAISFSRIIPMLGSSLTSLPANVIILSIVYFLITFLISAVFYAFNISYFYNLFKNLKAIKQKGQEKNIITVDGYTTGKKILITILTLVVFAWPIIMAISSAFAPEPDYPSPYSQGFQPPTNTPLDY